MMFWQISDRSIAAANDSTVGCRNSVATGTVRPNAVSMSRSPIARSESPPRSKKLPSTPTRGSRNSRHHMPASAISVWVRGEAPVGSSANWAVGNARASVCR